MLPKNQDPMLNKKLKVKVFKVKLVKDAAHFSVWQLAIFAVVFGGIGTYILLRSFATSPLVAIVQAEQMTLPAGSTIITDSAASGGQAVQMTKDSTSLLSQVTLPGSATSLSLVAKGVKCRNAWPQVSLLVDGSTVLPLTKVASSTWHAYPASVSLSAASHSLKIIYSNANNCGKALFIDVTDFYGEAVSVPTVSLGASPTSVTAGNASTLTWRSTNATSCSASGDWSGTEPTSGSVSTGALSASATYNLTCVGTSGTAQASAVVTVTPSGTSIPSTIADDCSVDVSAPILSWIASVPNNSTLLFGSNKCYRVESTLQLTGRSGLDLEGNGSTFKSLNAPDDQRAVWRIYDSSNMKLSHMIIIGSYASGGTFNSGLQHAHGIDLRGTNAGLSFITLSNLGGDCVYFGLGGTSAYTKSSGSFNDSSCVGTGRNAVSFTAAQNITVQRVVTDKIGYDVYDVEPNVGPNWGVSNVAIDSATIKSSYLAGFSVVESAPISDISFTNSKFVGRGLKITAGDPFGTGIRPIRITIKGNSSDTAQPPSAFNLDNMDIVTVTGNTVPLTGGVMAQADSSCKVSVSGNSFPGGSQEVSITNPKTTC